MKAINFFTDLVIKKISCTSVLFIFLLSALAAAQEKTKLSAEDYHLWSELNLLAISSQGNYVCYSTQYKTGKDTVFVMDVATKRNWAFPGGKAGKFIGDNKFICQVPGNEVRLLNMVSAKNTMLYNSCRFEIIQKSSSIITFDKGYGIESTMTIRDKDGAVLNSVNDVTEYQISPKEDMLLYSSGAGIYSKLGIITFSPYSNTVLHSGKTYTTLSWQKNGQSIACIKHDEKQKIPAEIFLYSLHSGRQKSFSPPAGGICEYHIITDRGIRISEDGKAVFFGVHSVDRDTIVKTDKEVQIWKGEDQFIYPVAEDMKEWKKISTLAVWYPLENFYRQFTSDTTSFALLSGDQQYAVTASTESYGPYFTYYPKGNLYCMSLRTGKTVAFLKGQSLDPSLISIGPSGSSMVYYKEGNWWCYDMRKNSHRSLTADLLSRWDNSNIPAAHQFSVYGVAGWSECGTYVLLYDPNDIWKINIITGKSERLSQGKENNTVVRMARSQFEKHILTNYSDRRIFLFDLEKELLFAVESNDCKFGYIVWNPKKGTSPLVLNKSIAEQCLRSENGYSVYLEQTFDRPPVLMFRNPDKKEPELLFSSNPQHKKYFWGRSELVRYNAPDGTPLKAALFYPAGYEKGKKYPMVVEVYEIRSKYLHRYENPSQENPHGFNTTNYTLDGYFVLLPDIAYTPGETGISASECVTAAVLAAGKEDGIDMRKIGLIGHSFGAYEANFILTHSSLFAAAVSGAGISDPIAFSFTIGSDVVAPQIWRFESQQFRMRTSFFTDKDAYLRNSPLYNADKITAPLLIWCGENDATIPKQESIILYNALRRLGKKHRMLIYPGEFHFLTEPDNKADLTLRVKQWFDYYLKGNKAEKWISDK